MSKEYLAILGRQPKLGLAELEALLGPNQITPLAENVVKITTTPPPIARLGGAKKIAEILAVTTAKDLPKIPQNHLRPLTGKVTIGFSAYNSPLSSRDLQNLALGLKKSAKKQGQSVRIVPNLTPELSTATVFHNKLGASPNKIEFLLLEKPPQIIVATLTETQNINAYRDRDQARPKRDATVGMLPPKLAQIMLNLALANQPPAEKTLLDPFCGTGVVLQEALLIGMKAYGTDLNEKMIDYTKQNLTWLKSKQKTHPQPAEKICDPLWAVRVTRGGAAPKNLFAKGKKFLGADRAAGPEHPSDEQIFSADVKSIAFPFKLTQADATTYNWQPPIDLVVSEIYLGQPFSAPPSDQKLHQVAATVQKILLTFLKNLAPQIPAGAPLCLAIPAWKTQKNRFHHLQILDSINNLGYNVHSFKNAAPKDLLYHRENQIVARELLVLRRK
jgi:tRNA G10  N-methylase Trm11